MARHTGGVLLLVPADPLRPRRPDGHFAAEAAAARDGGIAVALIDHDALADPGGAQRAVARVPDAVGAAVYRGWMMSSASYAALAGALSAKGVRLRTDAASTGGRTSCPAGIGRWPRSPRRRRGPTETTRPGSGRRASASVPARRCCATTSSP